MASIDRIKNVATKIIKATKQGETPVIVVSAMSGETDKLISLSQQAYQLCDLKTLDNFSLSDYDSIVSTGEQVSAGLLAIILTSMGYKAKSFCGWQIGLSTTNNYSKALIESCSSDQILNTISEGVIPVITGFQGINDEANRITTLGRGGSDTSAVAIAIAIKATRCDIYTDVDGVYTTDPRVVQNAYRIEKISFEEMLEMASVGAKVLQVRSVGLAMRYGMKTRVLSTFSDDNTGTTLTVDSDIMEQKVVTGVVADNNEVQITLYGLADKIGVCAKLFDVLNQNGINVDMIVQVSSQSTTADLTFTVNKADLNITEKILKENQEQIEFQAVVTRANVSKISIVGMGMKVNSGVAFKMFDILAKEGINIIAISTSEIRISVLIDSKYSELAVRALHAAFIE